MLGSQQSLNARPNNGLGKKNKKKPNSHFWINFWMLVSYSKQLCILAFYLSLYSNFVEKGKYQD